MSLNPEDMGSRFVKKILWQLTQAKAYINKTAQQQKNLLRYKISNGRWNGKEYFHLKYSQKIKDIKGEMQREDLCEFLLFGTA